MVYRYKFLFLNVKVKSYDVPCEKLIANRLHVASLQPTQKFTQTALTTFGQNP